MLKVKDGNLDQLGLLFERYHRLLYRFFQNYHQRVECQDLVQTVFMRILKYRTQFNENEGEFKTWMFRIARNVNMDFFKKQKRKGIKYKVGGKSNMRIRNGNILLDFETFNGNVYVKSL